jgi:hypothetical protein
MLRATLTPVSDTPEDLARRDKAAIAQAMECLRLARKYPGNPSFVLKCTAQAASMMRQGGPRGRCCRASRPSARSERRTAPPRAPRSRSRRWERSRPHHPPPDIAAEADSRALSHRVALIRTLGRLPDRLNCGPLPPELVKAIATGNMPVLRSLSQGTRARTASVA